MSELGEGGPDHTLLPRPKQVTTRGGKRPHVGQEREVRFRKGLLHGQEQRGGAVTATPGPGTPRGEG